MRRHRLDVPDIHIFEPGGRGGVYQHAVALADLVSQEVGRPVILHTGRHPEFAPAHARVCECADWPSGRLRRTRTVARYLWRTVPHIARAVSRRDVLHVEGRALPGFMAVAMLVPRLRGCRVVLSPHNMFARKGTRAEKVSLWTELRLADAVVVFSEADAIRATDGGISATVSPLLMAVPNVEPAAVAARRDAWRPDGRRVVLFAGYLRPDKGLDTLIRATALLPADEWMLAVVGQDAGAAKGARELAQELDLRVAWELGYQSHELFATTIAAADVVALPYEVASQSAVLAFANRLGTPTAAHAVGGLGESATVSFSSLDPSAVAAAILQAAQLSVEQPELEALTWRAHAAVYASS
jgi:glycosyltransferase involved in cell wall biosynthesis